MQTHDTILLGWDKDTHKNIFCKTYAYKTGEKDACQLDLKNIQDAGHPWRLGAIEIHMDEFDTFTRLKEAVEEYFEPELIDGHEYIREDHGDPTKIGETVIEILDLQ